MVWCLLYCVVDKWYSSAKMLHKHNCMDILEAQHEKLPASPKPVVYIKRQSLDEYDARGRDSALCDGKITCFLIRLSVPSRIHKSTFSSTSSWWLKTTTKMSI